MPSSEDMDKKKHMAQSKAVSSSVINRGMTARPVAGRAGYHIWQQILK